MSERGGTRTLVHMTELIAYADAPLNRWLSSGCRDCGSDSHSTLDFDRGQFRLLMMAGSKQVSGSQDDRYL